MNRDTADSACAWEGAQKVVNNYHVNTWNIITAQFHRGFGKACYAFNCGMIRPAISL